MDAARPKGAKESHLLTPEGDPEGAIEALQLEAFEADGHEWWLVTTEAEMLDSILWNYEDKNEDAGEGGEGESA
jgi:hypothetical protein